MLLRHDYNGPEIDFLLGALGPGGVALDIGSNIGLYSLPMARAVGSEGRVVAIDANAAMVERLTFNADASGIGQVAAVHAAVGGSEGRVDLHIRKDDVAIVRVEQKRQRQYPDVSACHDSCENLGIAKVDALKIDIEGYEDAALVPYLDEAEEAMRPGRIR